MIKQNTFFRIIKNSSFLIFEVGWIFLISMILLFLYDFYFLNYGSTDLGWITNLVNWVKDAFTGKSLEDLPIYFLNYDINYIMTHNLITTVKLVISAIIVLLILVALFTFLIHLKELKWMKHIVTALGFLSNVHAIYYCVLLRFLGIHLGFHWSMIFILAVSGGLFINFYRSIENDFIKIIQSDYMIALKVLGEAPIDYMFRPIISAFLTETKAVLPLILSSTLFIEFFFNIQGIGRLLEQSFFHKAVPVLLYVSLSVLLFMVVMNILLDSLLYLFNPTREEIET